MTEKRFTSVYNNQSDMIQYVDTQKEEPNRWSICNVSETLQKLNELQEENIRLKRDFDSCSHNWALMYDEAKNKVEELHKENIVLKLRMKKAKDLLEDFVFKITGITNGDV